jgi:hypothetical protein
MSSDDRHDPVGQAGSGALTALVLELALDSGEPVGGFVGPAGEHWRLAFRGWVDLMSAINSIRMASAVNDEARPPG